MSDPLASSSIIGYDDAELVGTHHYSFRKGVPAEIIGVVFIKPNEEYDWRPCFQVRYADGFVDFVPISESAHYRLQRKNAVQQGEGI